MDFLLMVLRKSFYIHWSAGRSPRVHEVNPGRDPSVWAIFVNIDILTISMARSKNTGKGKAPSSSMKRAVKKRKFDTSQPIKKRKRKAKRFIF